MNFYTKIDGASNAFTVVMHFRTMVASTLMMGSAALHSVDEDDPRRLLMLRTDVQASVNVIQQLMGHVGVHVHAASSSDQEGSSAAVFLHNYVKGMRGDISRLVTIVNSGLDINEGTKEARVIMSLVHVFNVLESRFSTDPQIVKMKVFFESAISQQLMSQITEVIWRNERQFGSDAEIAAILREFVEMGAINASS